MPRFPERIRGVSLDFANTIYPLRAAETAATIRYLHAFLERRLGKELPGGTLHDLYIEIRERQFAENRETLRENDFPARLREMIARVDRDPSDELVEEASQAYAEGFIATIRLPDGVLDVLTKLSQQYAGRVVVCSNFIISEAIKEPLRRDRVMPLLAGVVVSCDVGFVKPHPLLFQRVAELLELPPNQIVHVGDDLDADIAGARNAGMTTVYTSQWCEKADSDKLTAASPDYSVTSLNQLLKLV